MIPHEYMQFILTSDLVIETVSFVARNYVPIVNNTNFVIIVHDHYILIFRYYYHQSYMVSTFIKVISNKFLNEKFIFTPSNNT